MDIIQLIIDIEKRPKMFVGENRLDYIYHYISGILTCYRYYKNYDEEDANFIFIYNFHYWVFEYITIKLKKECEFSFLWYKMISSIVDSEEEENELFFEISKDFFTAKCGANSIVYFVD